MEIQEALRELIYSILTGAVPSTIAILVPLMGAYWIFKVKEKSAAEGKIFEFGRDIANLLINNEPRGPIDLFSDAYLNKALQGVNENNKNKAISELLRKNLRFLMFGEHEDHEEKEAAKIVIAIVSERAKHLVPLGVNWSGRGAIYNLFGVNVVTTDSCFPFGTKLYRKWVEDFGIIYNDLWAVSKNREYVVGSFLKEATYSEIGIDGYSIESWLDKLDSNLYAIYSFHSKILTQLQIIDVQIDLPRLKKDIALIFLYLFLLIASGFVIPRLMRLLELGTTQQFLFLASAAILSYALIGLRIFLGSKPSSNKEFYQNLVFDELRKNLEKMRKVYANYDPIMVRNVVSLSSSLRLNKKLVKDLSLLLDKLEYLNHGARLIVREIEPGLLKLKDDYGNSKGGQGGVSINILELALDPCGPEKINKKIEESDSNIILSYQEMGFTRDLMNLKISGLSREERTELSSRVITTINSLKKLPIHKTTCIAMQDFCSQREKALKHLK